MQFVCFYHFVSFYGPLEYSSQKFVRNTVTSHITAEFLRWVMTTRIPYYSYQHLVGKREGKEFAERLWCGSDDNIKMDTK